MKIMLIELSVVLLTACGNEKSKDSDKAKDKTSETTPETSAPASAATGKDAEHASATWIVSEGNFYFQSIVDMRKIIEKRVEDILFFKAEYGSDDVNVLKPLN